MPRSLLLVCLLGVSPLAPVCDTELRPLEFHVTFDPQVSAAPFSGRVYVLLSRQTTREPRSGINWFNPEPVFARDVKGWKPGETLVVAADALAYPTPLARLPKETYSIQAVMDFDRGERSFSNATGNGYSPVVRLALDPAASGPVPLAIRQ